jgi:hypothetical protein
MAHSEEKPQELRVRQPVVQIYVIRTTGHLPMRDDSKVLTSMSSNVLWGRDKRPTVRYDTESGGMGTRETRILGNHRTIYR